MNRIDYLGKPGLYETWRDFLGEVGKMLCVAVPFWTVVYGLLIYWGVIG